MSAWVRMLESGLVLGLAASVARQWASWSVIVSGATSVRKLEMQKAWGSAQLLEVTLVHKSEKQSAWESGQLLARKNSCDSSHSPIHRFHLQMCRGQRNTLRDLGSNYHQALSGRI